MHSIYIIEKIDDSRKYIGQTVDIQKRWCAHRRAVRHCLTDTDKTGYQYVAKAMAKYGIEKFKFSIYKENLTQEEADDIETHLIDLYQTRVYGKGFNVHPGGHNNVGCGLDHPLYGKPAHNRLLTDEQEKEICRIYVEEKIPAWKVGKKLGCKQSSVYRALGRYDIPILGNKYFSKGKTYSPETTFKKGQIPNNKFLSEEQEKEICKRYVEEKLSTKVLGKIYSCRKNAISNALIRHGIDRRNAGYYKIGKSPTNKLFSAEQEKEICDKYIKESFSTSKMAEIYHCNRTTIADILCKYNIEIRNPGFYRRKVSKDQEKEICDKYLSGALSTIKLGEEYNCTRRAISKILERNNIEKRAR